MSHRFGLLICLVVMSTTSFAQVADKAPAPRVTEEQRKALANSEMYECSMAIREKKGDAFKEVATPRLIARKGMPCFAGLPHDNADRNDPTCPSRVYCRTTVADVKGGIAQLRVTVGHTSDLGKVGSDTTWTEQTLSAVRDVRLGEPVAIQVPAIANSSNPQSFEFSIKVERFEAKPK